MKQIALIMLSSRFRQLKGTSSVRNHKAHATFNSGTRRGSLIYNDIVFFYLAETYVVGQMKKGVWVSKIKPKFLN